MIENGYKGITLRKSFSKIPAVLDYPHLLEVQLKSYTELLQIESQPSERLNAGIQRAFNLVFPIEDYNDKA